MDISPINTQNSISQDPNWINDAKANLQSIISSPDSIGQQRLAQHLLDLLSETPPATQEYVQQFFTHNVEVRNVSAVYCGLTQENLNRFTCVQVPPNAIPYPTSTLYLYFNSMGNLHNFNCPGLQNAIFGMMQYMNPNSSDQDIASALQGLFSADFPVPGDNVDEEKKLGRFTCEMFNIPLPNWAK